MEGDRFHLQRVRENRAAEPEPAAKEPGQDLPGQRRRVVRVQGRVDDVRGHEGGDPRADRPFERVDVAGVKRPPGAAHDGQDLVGIRFRVAVAGEMLPDGKDVAGKRAPHEGDPDARDLLRIPGERPVPDHRVDGIAVYVEHGREVDVDADRRQFPGKGGARRRRRLFGAAAEDGIAPRRGELRERRVLEPRDPAPLLVDGDQRRRASSPGRRADLAAQFLDLPGVFQVAGEEDDAGRRAVAQPGGQRGSHRLPLEPHHQERGRGISDAQPGHPTSRLPW